MSPLSSIMADVIEEYKDEDVLVRFVYKMIMM